jgi:hypothetical protein
MTSAEEREELTRAIAVFVAERIEQATKPLRERIIELEKRGVNYCGVYQRAALYRRGDIVTVDGSMYVAIADVEPNQAPGNGNNWQLCVKKGADGRDANRAPTRPGDRGR